jgi:hypothetical protein
MEIRHVAEEELLPYKVFGKMNLLDLTDDERIVVFLALNHGLENDIYGNFDKDIVMNLLDKLTDVFIEG